MNVKALDLQEIFKNINCKFDRGVSLLCWAYNEEELIEDYLTRCAELLSKNIEDFEIVVVDDCSTDQTNDIVRRLQTSIPQIKLCRNPVNLNVGLSFQKALANASKELLFWQTIDWAYDIADLRLFLELTKHYDIVTGVRIAPVLAVDKKERLLLSFLKLFGMQHITKRSDTIKKALVSLCNYVLIRVLYKMPLSDFQNVSFYPTKLIQSIKYESRSSFSNPEGILKSYWQGASIIEVPISFIPRSMGEAKGTKLAAIKSSIKDVFGLWFKWIVLGRIPNRGKGSVVRLDMTEWTRAKSAYEKN